jgi:aminoglycoside phosphotransferase (APT) family kinase protein
MAEGSVVDTGAGDLAAVLARLRAAGLGDYRPVRRLVGGDHGAHEVVDATGRPAVFKWRTDPSLFADRAEAVVLSERLRIEAGWPVPAQVVLELPGLQATVQERCAGIVARSYTRPVVDVLLALHRTRLGLARPGDLRTFGDELVTTLTVGGNGYCRHDAMRAHDARTRRLLERFAEIGSSLDVAALPSGDVVHGDLHAENVLVVDGQLSAVIDTEFSFVGDAGFDLVMLALSAGEHDPDPTLVAELWERVHAEVDRRFLPAYSAHLLLRCIDWEIRSNGSALLDHWLAEAERRLPAG